MNAYVRREGSKRASAWKAGREEEWFHYGQCKSIDPKQTNTYTALHVGALRLPKQTNTYTALRTLRKRDVPLRQCYVHSKTKGNWWPQRVPGAVSMLIQYVSVRMRVFSAARMLIHCDRVMMRVL